MWFEREVGRGGGVGCVLFRKGGRGWWEGVMGTYISYDFGEKERERERESVCVCDCVLLYQGGKE